MNLFELEILNYIQEHIRCGFLDILMPLITALDNGGVFYIILALILLIFKKTRKVGCYLALALIFGLIAGNLILKNAVARTRPYDMPQALSFDLLINKPRDFSFPSGHTLVACEGAVVMWFYSRRAGIAATVLGALIAFSRLYLYVHYPTDILGGIALGIITSLCAVFTVNKIWAKIWNSKKKA